jgi:hypothetical protein
VGVRQSALTFHALCTGPRVFYVTLVKEAKVKKARFLGGLLMIVAAAVVFLVVSDAPVAVSIALLVVGIALVATSRRMS